MPNYARHEFDAELAKSLEKPFRGAAKLDRIKRGKRAHAKEDAQKAKVRKRDGHCRWPHLSPDLRELCKRTQTEVAHLSKAKIVYRNRGESVR
jgi:hypothetical protein